MRIAVCDDNEMCLLELNEQLLSTSLVKKVHTFSDLKAFLSSVENRHFYDAVFMDIDWGNNSKGIDAAERLLELSPETKIIYITGYGGRFSQNIFLRRANLSGFLTKPIDGDLLIANLQKVAETSPLPEQPSIVLRQGGSMITVPCSEIIYMESKGRTIELHMDSGVEVFYGKLGSVLQMLPVWFVECHKSYVVNMRWIQRFHPNEIQLKNGEIIPASRSKLGKARQAYFAFIGETF